LTSAAPVLELGRILAARGHRVEFATHKGQEKWVDSPSYSFLSGVHSMGAAMDAATEEAHYLELQDTDIRKDMTRYIAPMFTIQAFWASDFEHLMRIVEALKPDMIVADAFVDFAVRDIQIQTGVPVATVWSQMPYGMLSAPYIPGIPGLQTAALTSEHASLWTRIRAALRPLRAAMPAVRYFQFLAAMRKENGINYALPIQNKPDYLVLANSFWGLETPKDLPPLVAAIGPILSDEYPPLTDQFDMFFASHRQVVYIAFGTHVRVRPTDLEKFIVALSQLIGEDKIDGVIWAASQAQSVLFDPYQRLPGHKHSFGDLANNRSPSWLFIPFAPQRAILDRPETALFVTHGGGSSINEALFHGKPMLLLGFFADQPVNGLRVEEAGIGLRLDKAGFSADEIYEKARYILDDESGTISQDVQRMKHIARISARKKEYGADLIQEVLYDCKYSQSLDGTPGRRRPMHLQTADGRMSAWRANNWDLRCIGLLSAAGLVGSVYYVYKWAEKNM
ncbi:UDP-glucosyl transferase family protein, partial [Plectosphaerella plurivora]